MILGLLLGCLHPAAPSPADCEAGDPAACHARAAMAPPDDPVAWQLDRWACDEGHAPACLALAERGASGLGSGDTLAQGARDLGRACELGLADACTRAAAYPDAPAATADLGLALLRACRAEDEAACARADTLGWRNPEVAAVRAVGDGFEPMLVLAGGTVLGRDGNELVADGPAGPFRAPLSEDAGWKLEDLFATVDGRVLTWRRDWVWSMLDGRTFSTRTWPPPAAAHAWTADGSLFVAALQDAPLVAWWDLASGRVADVIPTGRSVESVDIAVDGRRIAVGGPKSALLDRVTGAAKELPCGGPTRFAPDGKRLLCWANGLAVVGVDGRVLSTWTSTAAGYTWSPDGTLIAVHEKERLVLLDAEDPTKVRAELRLPPGPIARPVWSPDGQRILVRGASAWVLSRPGAREGLAMDKAVIEGLRSLPRPPEGPVASRDDLQIAGVITRAGGPVRSAEVRISPCTPGPTAPAPARSGHDGSFHFNQVPRGCWWVDVTADGLTTRATASAAMTIDLPAPQTYTGVVRVAGRPVPATVAAWAAGRDEPLAVVQADRRGHYELSAAGATLIEAYTVDHVGQSPTGGDLTLDTPYAPLQLVGTWPQPGLSAHGYPQPDGSRLVVGLAPGSTTRLHNVEQGLAGPTVEVTLPHEGVVQVPPVAVTTLHVHFARLSADDTLTVDGATCVRHADGCRATVASGWYTVSAVRASDHTWGSTQVEATGSDTVIEAPLDGKLVSVRGRVVDSVTGAALAGLRVRLGDSSARTGPDGRFRLPHVRPGAATLEIPASAAFRAWSRPVEPGAEALDLGDLALPR